MCKYYGYIRVSTETQAEHGGGLDVQTAAVKKYAAAQGWKLERIFVDAGISGTTENRPALDELLLETIEAGDVIIVHNTSRLWRSIFAQATVMKAVINAKANIKSIDEPSFDIYKYMTEPDNFMISGMMGMLDQWERMTIARKLARGRATKAAKGDKPAGAVPYGYRYTPDKKAVEINPDEAPTVKRMFSLAQTGKSLAQIKADLDAQGITTRRGNPFSRGSVAAILANRFYAGELTHDSKEAREAPDYKPNYIKGSHPALISKVQFGKVQAQLAKHSKNQKPAEKPQEATTAPAQATPDHSAQPMQEAAQSAPQAAQLATIKAEIKRLSQQRDEARKAGDNATARWYAERAEALKDEAREIEWANH